MKLRLVVNLWFPFGLQQSFAIVIAIDLLTKAFYQALEIIDLFMDCLDSVSLLSRLLEITLLGVVRPPFSITVLAVLAELPTLGGRLFGIA